MLQILQLYLNIDGAYLQMREPKQIGYATPHVPCIEQQIF
jgi:hypothetical protein